MLVKKMGNKYRVKSTKVKRCEHGTEKYCKDSGGGGICVHGKQKQQGKECFGSGLCKVPL